MDACYKNVLAYQQGPDERLSNRGDDGNIRRYMIDTPVTMNDLDYVMRDMWPQYSVEILKSTRVANMKSRLRNLRISGSDFVEVIDNALQRLPRMKKPRSEESTRRTSGSIRLKRYITSSIKKKNASILCKATQLEEEKKRRMEDEVRRSQPDGDCNICFDPKKGFELVPCRSEGTTHYTCTECLRQYIANMVSGTADQIKCVACTSVYRVDDIHTLVPKDMISKLEIRQRTLDCQVALNSGDVSAVMYCKCGNVAVIETKSKGDGTVTCPNPKCTNVYCMKCSNRVHPGELCPPITDSVIQYMKQKKGRRCPHCGAGITRSSGCNHITCSKLSGGCGGHFCYNCGKAYKKRVQQCSCGLYD